MKSNTRVDRRLLAELVKGADPKKLFDPDGLLAEELRQKQEGSKADLEVIPWLPWILLGHPGTPPLPFFVRAQGAAGIENLLACLGMDPTRDSVARLRQAVISGLGRLPERSGWERQAIQSCLNSDKWNQGQ